jgi:hypothetical protein
MSADVSRPSYDLVVGDRDQPVDQLGGEGRVGGEPAQDVVHEGTSCPGRAGSARGFLSGSPGSPYHQTLLSPVVCSAWTAQFELDSLD